MVRCGGQGQGVVSGRRAIKQREAWAQVGAEARTEHTSNMAPMLVTPEVSQLEMSALKDVLSLKSSNMLVMAETSQWAMGPYFAMAEAALSVNSSRASSRAFRLAKAYGGGEGGGGEGGGEGGGGLGCGEGEVAAARSS